MKRNLNFILVTLAIALITVARLTAEEPAAELGAGSAVDTNAPAGDTNLTARSFDVLQRRNIFNPNRRPIRQRVDAGPRVQIDSFKLNGTMSYEDKAYAFFDGSTAQFRNKTLGRADKIGGYTIAEITNNAVKLTTSSNDTVSLHVGMQMRRENNGPWKLITNGEPPAEPSSDSSEADGSSSAGSSIGAVDDVMKRLMERREKENKDSSIGNDKQNENN